MIVKTAENPRAMGRYPEIDFLRGSAVVMMVAFHFIFDLNFLGIYEIQVYSGWLGWFAYLIGTMFLLFVGISLTISYRRAVGKMDARSLRRKYLKRGVQIFALGLVITVVTMIYPGRGFVVFGVLHCIGLSIVAAYVLLPYRWLNLVLGIAIVAIGVFIAQSVYAFPWLVWLGFAPVGSYSIDYFPLLPWFGIVLLGVFVGNMIYRNPSRAREGSWKGWVRSLSPFLYLGRHSLVIYLLHQPILFGILYAYVAST